MTFLPMLPLSVVVLLALVMAMVGLPSRRIKI